MHSLKFTGLLRFISILIILLVVFLYIMLNKITDNVISLKGDRQPGKDYEYRVTIVKESVPVFTDTLESHFLKLPVMPVRPGAVETKIAIRPATPVEVPPLRFIGMIETDGKVIYSFRNGITNKLLMLRKGIEIDGITLISVLGSKFILKKNGITFQVDKK